jgi:hypothetical protein
MLTLHSIAESFEAETNINCNLNPLNTTALPHVLNFWRNHAAGSNFSFETHTGNAVID